MKQRQQTSGQGAAMSFCSRWRIWVGWGLRLGLAVLFVYAGWVKLMSPADFLQDILNYQLVGSGLALGLAVALPPLEILLGLCLLVRPMARTAAVWIVGLCSVFLLALLLAWVRGLDISCGCFGGSAAVAYPQAVLRDLGLIAGAMVLVIILRDNRDRRGK